MQLVGRGRGLGALSGVAYALRELRGSPRSPLVAELLQPRRRRTAAVARTCRRRGRPPVPLPSRLERLLTIELAFGELVQLGRDRRRSRSSEHAPEAVIVVIRWALWPWWRREGRCAGPFHETSRMTWPSSGGGGGSSSSGWGMKLRRKSIASVPPNSGSTMDATCSADWIWAFCTVCMTSWLSWTCVRRMAVGENSMCCNAPFGATRTVTASLGAVTVLLACWICSCICWERCWSCCALDSRSAIICSGFIARSSSRGPDRDGGPGPCCPPG